MWLKKTCNKNKAILWFFLVFFSSVIWRLSLTLKVDKKWQGLCMFPILIISTHELYELTQCTILSSAAWPPDNLWPNSPHLKWILTCSQERRARKTYNNGRWCAGKVGQIWCKPARNVHNRTSKRSSVLDVYLSLWSGSTEKFTDCYWKWTKNSWNISWHSI